MVKLLLSKKFKNLSDISPSIEYVEDLDFNNISNEERILGQGLNGFVKQLTKAFPKNEEFTLEEKEYVHKKNNKNVIVTKPKQLETNTFESQVFLNSEMAEIEDHLTGYHIPAMVITEASRQMMISVIERFYSEFQSVGECYFIINNIDSNFDNFLFPWQVSLTFTINSMLKLKNCIKYESTSIFKQNGEVCSQICINFSVFNKKSLLKLEKHYAQASLNKYINEATNK
ncbi:MAG: AfsA-related hotdog domain-containing protein [Pseudomonadota bacterium]